MKYLYFISPMIVMYAVFYLWNEVIPDGHFWWSVPTVVTTYVIVGLAVIDAAERFSKYVNKKE